MTGGAHAYSLGVCWFCEQQTEARSVVVELIFHENLNY